MSLPSYRYNGARSMVLLHERELRRFIGVWKQAKVDGAVILPVTDDPSYTSLDHLAQHVLRAARGYMVWMCEKLELPDPAIPPTPSPDEIVSQIDSYLEAVLAGWRKPLKDVREERFDEVYPSRWKIDYCIDAMLEHAVMHPIRHRFQLENLMR